MVVGKKPQAIKNVVLLSWPTGVDLSVAMTGPELQLGWFCRLCQLSAVRKPEKMNSRPLVLYVLIFTSRSLYSDAIKEF